MFHMRLSSLSSTACSLCIVSSRDFRVLRRIRTFSAQQQLLSQRLRNDFTSSSFIPELLRSSASSLSVISGIVTFRKKQKSTGLCPVLSITYISQYVKCLYFILWYALNVYFYFALQESFSTSSLNTATPLSISSS